MQHTTYTNTIIHQESRSIITNQESWTMTHAERSKTLRVRGNFDGLGPITTSDIDFSAREAKTTAYSRPP